MLKKLQTVVWGGLGRADHQLLRAGQLRIRETDLLEE